MTVSADVLRHHIEYTIWATDRLLKAGSELTPDQLEQDFGTADKSVKGTLVHIFRAERTWLRRLQEGAPTIPWGFPEDAQWAALLKEWAGVQQGWKEWAGGLSDGDASRIIDYLDLKGRPWSQPVWPIVFHVVNHSTHHRGQVAGFLRAFGMTPPPLDFIAFVREHSA